MKQFKTLLVDDKPKELESLKEFLNMRTDKFNIFHESTSFEDAVQILQSESFELSILDNLLNNNQDASGLIKAVKYKKNLGIIAVTSIKSSRLVDDFANRLLIFGKPHTARRLNQFITDLDSRWEIMQLNETPEYVLNKSDKIFQAKLNKILFFQACGNYTKVYFEPTYASNSKVENPFLHNELLGDLLENITSTNFYRCHKSYAVNKNLIIFAKKEGFKFKIYFCDAKGNPILDSKFTAVASREVKKYLILNTIATLKR